MNAEGILICVNLFNYWCFSVLIRVICGQKKSVFIRSIRVTRVPILREWEASPKGEVWRGPYFTITFTCLRSFPAVTINAYVPLLKPRMS